MRSGKVVGVNVTAAVCRVLVIQAAVLLTLFFAAVVLLGWLMARSVLLGGLIAFVPNAYFALKISRNRKKAPQQIVRGFYLGEVVKLALTAALFFLVLQMPDIQVLPLFLGFIAVLGGFWIALLTE